MRPENYIVKYLDDARLVHIATCVGSQPWAASVYYAVDNLHCLYFLSRPNQRHSQDIRANPKVAGTIAIPVQPGQPLQGLQFQGVATEILQADTAAHFQAYAERYNYFSQLESIVSGKNPIRLFMIKPELFVLHDELHFPDQPQQEWRLSA